eukprot:4420600-Amphidinium_carterae.1
MLMGLLLDKCVNRKRDSTLDVRDIPTPALIASVDHRQYDWSADGVIAQHAHRVRFEDAPGVSFPKLAQKQMFGPTRAKIFLLEYCCDENSMLGRDHVRGGIETTRITRDMYATKCETIDATVR